MRSVDSRRPFSFRKQRHEQQLEAAAELIRNSEYFDPDWYVTHNAGGLKVDGDVALHYLRHGRRYGFEPGPHFSGQRYLERYPDVAAEDIDPLVHYLRYGRYENRTISGANCAGSPQSVVPPPPARRAVSHPAPAPSPASRVRPAPTLRKLSRKELRAQADLIRQSEHFDESWYVETNLEGAYPPDAVVHYLTVGAQAGFDPSPSFSRHRYLAAYPDVADEGLDPLVHYLLHGRDEGRMAYPVPATPLLRESPRTAEAPAPQMPFASFPITSAPAAIVNNNVGISSDSPSILFVSGEPDTPGNYYRIINYVEAASANGWRADWIRGDELSDHMSKISDFDVLVIWRKLWDANVEEAIGIMRSLGRTVIFDCDDLMTEPRLATIKLIDGIRSQFLTEEAVQEFYGRIRETMLAADLCFTTTEQLAFHMRSEGRITFVNPNGFSQFTHDLSRRSSRDWSRRRDGLIRIGYAGGSRTHQRDLGLAIGAICRILREHPEVRLVLFRAVDGEKLPLIDVEEFPDLDGLHDQIEWRPLQPLRNLPTEKARFDINLAPLEVGNPFCEAKSQLKFFEAGLVNCPTVASPTGPFRDCISHGTTGFLAATGDDWYACLKQLVTDPDLRGRVGRNAYLSALANFGPRSRALQFGCVLDQLKGGATAARGFALRANQTRSRPRLPEVYPSDILFEADKGGQAEVAVVIPLYNYASVVVEALDSVRDQTLEDLDLVIVDGCSTDNSLEVALRWAKENAGRFNRITVLKNRANYKLGLCRNTGIDAADAPYVMLLDADNRLLPQCCEKLLAGIKQSGAAYVYGTIQQFGARDIQFSNVPYRPQRFVSGNFVDAMAMISKEAWAMIGGIDHVRHGWEDYDFWVRIAEHGLTAEWVPELVAEYRVHETSMMTRETMVGGNYRELNLDFARRHPWTALIDTEIRRYPRSGDPQVTDPSQRTRLDDLLPILKCPVSGQKLAYDETRVALVSYDGMIRWPIREGRPCLSRDLSDPQVMPPNHVSNVLPDEALRIIKEAKGWVLNLSAGGSLEKFPNVVEMEFAVFRHTDVVADAHQLPFDDESFEAVVVMNAFEHYHDPNRVAAELRRVLKPGGQIHVCTAFLQPLHEKPYHFYNCTRYGMEKWFEDFDIDLLHVSPNFNPNHTLAWIASEAESALRHDVSNEAADHFMSAPIGQLIEIWRDPTKRNERLWTAFEGLSQENQNILAAGFEMFAKRPPDAPEL